MRGVVLSIGIDGGVLNSRNMVLRQAGYSVTATLNHRSARHLLADGDFDAVILCHTLGDEDKVRLIADFKSERPLTPIITVENDSGHILPADASVRALDGPRRCWKLWPACSSPRLPCAGAPPRRRSGGNPSPSRVAGP